MNTYKILLLGASGSGKTIFLASMFRKLLVQTGGIGFRLEASSPDQGRILTNIYETMIDPDMPWPPGTRRDKGEVKEWEFTCCVNTATATHPVFKFTYLDYAGGYITDIPEDGTSDFEIEDKAKESDALLVLLDGQKVLYLMEGKQHPTLRSLKFDLNHILPILEKLQSKPVHFVISKWDVLQDKYTLEQVRDRLLADQWLRSIVDRRRTWEIPARLIPTSALGYGFARLEEDGVMKKTPGVMPEPFQVEMPLACVLIDAFKSARKEANARQISLLIHLKILWWRFLHSLRIVGKASPLVIPPLGAAAVQVLSYFADGRIKKSLIELERQKEFALNAIQDQETAITSAINSYGFLIGKLEEVFPDSNLYRV